MSKKLFVGGLAWATTDDSLNAAFAPFGKVVEAKVIFDRQTGRSRGFGFVAFDTEEAAAAAREALNETELDGRMIRINDAEESSRRPNAGARRPAPQRQKPSEYQENRDRRPDSRRSFSNEDFAFIPDGNAGRGGRDARRKDRKKDRDRYEDDRW